MIFAFIFHTTTAIQLNCLYPRNPKFCTIRENNSTLVKDANEIHFITSETGESIGKIEDVSISIRGNRMPFPTNIYKSFPNLKRLHVTTQLPAITWVFFRNASTLTLDTGHNHLQTIQTPVFAGAKNLRSLYLFHNVISRIDDFAFDGLTELKVLDISSNRLTKINRFAFAGLLLLQRLHLSDNQIAEIEDGALNFPKIERLELDGNQLKILSGTLFA